MGAKPLFTARDLERFAAQGRGRGTFTDYIPWHRVNRSDPSSIGRSHLHTWDGRQRELLSDLEQIAFLFSTMHPYIVDIREQYPLNLHAGAHELNTYRAGAIHGTVPGTIAIAETIGIKHPRVPEDTGTWAPWIMTTDLLLAIKEPSGNIYLLAIAVKPKDKWSSRKTKVRLNLERMYWSSRNVPWLLITETQYDSLVGDQMKGVWNWAFSEPADPPLIKWIVASASQFHNASLTRALDVIANRCGSVEKAQDAFWQSVWAGNLPIDLRRGWRPSEPLILVSQQQFWARNPVVCRRSAWTL